MPYLTKVRRTAIDLSSEIPKMETPGDLNYFITRVILKYLRGTEKRYADYNAVMGVLGCVQQELYRRIIGPYEDSRKAENGDVYS